MHGARPRIAHQREHNIATMVLHTVKRRRVDLLSRGQVRKISWNQKLTLVITARSNMAPVRMEVNPTELVATFHSQNKRQIEYEQKYQEYTYE